MDDAEQVGQILVVDLKVKETVVDRAVLASDAFLVLLNETRPSKKDDPETFIKIFFSKLTRIFPFRRIVETMRILLKALPDSKSL